ncbi:hypothetical protein L195_g044690 [Trifolium pratense]|uniref:Uncharacterized protein n=1 Tax=Trifolium pratense TaxID=57577 RepID=A0A2K3MCR0_TRIPR|nr:hypothetical protein L195_g044690 [Trifolium pratense]
MFVGRGTTLHCLRDCVAAQRIWSSLDFNNTDFFSAFVPELWVRNHSSGNNAPKFLAGLWWNRRARNIVCVGNESVENCLENNDQETVELLPFAHDAQVFGPQERQKCEFLGFCFQHEG